MGRFRVWIEKFLEEKAATPDYSIDRWIKSAQQLGSQVDSFVSSAKEKEAETDKKIEDKKKKDKKEDEKKDEKKPKDQKDELPFDPKDKNWKELKKIHKERLDKDKESWKTSSPTKNSNTSPKKN